MSAIVAADTSLKSVHRRARVSAIPAWLGRFRHHCARVRDTWNSPVSGLMTGYRRCSTTTSLSVGRHHDLAAHCSAALCEETWLRLRLMSATGRKPPATATPSCLRQGSPPLDSIHCRRLLSPLRSNRDYRANESSPHCQGPSLEPMTVPPKRGGGPSLFHRVIRRLGVYIGREFSGEIARVERERLTISL